MIGTITPLVEEAPATRRWTSSLVAYGVGSVATSALVGAAWAVSGRIVGGPWQWRMFVLAVIALTLSLIEFGLIPRKYPSTWRQTKKHWRKRFGPIRAAFLWGADLGLGITTRITFSSYWLLIAACIVSADVTQGAVLMGGYGLGRGVLVATGPVLFSDQDSETLGTTLFAQERLWHRIHGCALVAAFILLIAYSGDI